ncbi:MAG: CapA family protein [Candidatus Zambryskibacteria bacterium]|nr:CapA family protein [Candidatus Zambryskibacteria bacterium]
MNKKYYTLLVLSLIVFFAFNFFIYTTSFEVSTEGIKYPVQQLVEQKNPSVLNFGDVIFDRGVRNIIENRGRDPFEYIKKDLNIINKFNVIIVNLEGPIVEMDRSKCQSKDYNFQFASTTPEFLKSVGVNMVNIANNHSYDCLQAGLDSTKEYLEKAGIDYIGDKELEKSYVIKTIGGKKIAFVGIDETVALIPVSNFYSLIKRLDTENDFVVVNIHWGAEYELDKTEAQIVIAHSLIDNGADVIFGHHPHVIESMEIYKNKAIFYSLGNFVFDQNFGDTTIGLGVGVKFKDEKSVFTIFPFNIKLFAPEFMKDEEKDLFCENYLKLISHTGCVFEI